MRFHRRRGGTGVLQSRIEYKQVNNNGGQEKFMRRIIHSSFIQVSVLLMGLAIPARAHAMHIAEGILPAGHAALWFLVSVIFVLWGLREIRLRAAATPHYKPFVALVGAAVFIISCMPIPVPVVGSCAHPVGMGLAAILIGPAPAVVLASIALALQALFMAHGGLTTLGANVAAMGVAGAFAGFGIFCLARRLGLPLPASAFLAGLLSDWATYSATSVVLTFALYEPGGFTAMLQMILVAFMPTQVPLGILEGILAAGALRFVQARMPVLIKGMQPMGGAV
jgi:cobalt/nickel transport system permease protein